MTNEPQTLIEAIRYFADEDVCHEFVKQMRWGDGPVICPTCGRDDVRDIPTRKMWECRSKHPRRQFSVKVGTIFEGSPVGLDKWLAAVWMIANAKNGVSSYEIARSIGVTQKTAWFMMHRIRLAMDSDSDGKFSGKVEVDETFIGGLARFMHKGVRERKIKGTGGVGKVAVMGLLERHGPDRQSRIRTQIVKNRRKRTLANEVRNNVEPGSQVFTDALRSYDDLDRDFVHQVINHAEEYVRGQVHTNGVENYWSLLKRAIRGTYVSVEPFHLSRYLDEQAFRFNTRKATDFERFSTVLATATGRRLTYGTLTGTAASF